MNSKSPVEIEAPSKEQIAAAKKMRRTQVIPLLHERNDHEIKQRRFGIEGVILLLLAMALLYFLYPLGTIAWILALLPFLGGIIALLKASK